MLYISHINPDNVIAIPIIITNLIIISLPSVFAATYLEILPTNSKTLINENRRIIFNANQNSLISPFANKVTGSRISALKNLTANKVSFFFLLIDITIVRQDILTLILYPLSASISPDLISKTRSKLSIVHDARNNTMNADFKVSFIFSDNSLLESAGESNFLDMISNRRMKLLSVLTINASTTFALSVPYKSTTTMKPISCSKDAQNSGFMSANSTNNCRFKKGVPDFKAKSLKLNG